MFTSACKILRRLGEQITLTDWMGAMAGLVFLDQPVAATVNTHQCLVSRLPGSALVKQAVREAATICPRPCKLTFDLLTLKVERARSSHV